ncbi:hypothetical protein ACWD3J_49875 [Streptomyces sp. NPDC002755]|uniref:hypothetical protein n=1 Tax=Streptomyces sp. NPDC002884 TaxID=3154544 RepID=UPI003329A002
MPHARKITYPVVLLMASFGLFACGSTDSGKANDDSNLTARSAEDNVSQTDPTLPEQPMPVPPILEVDNNPGPREPKQGGNSVKVCAERSFQRCVDFSAYTDSARILDDSIGSIQNNNDFPVTFYADPHFSGDSITLGPGEVKEDLDPPGSEQGINDRISSWQPQGLAQTNPVITVCTGEDFRGKCEDVPISQAATKLNDDISSIRNSSDFDIIFYTDENYKGSMIEVHSQTYVKSINPKGVNNGLDDKISSWQPLSGPDVSGSNGSKDPETVDIE